MSQKSIISIIAISHFLLGTAIGIQIVSFPFILKSHGISEFHIGLIVTFELAFSIVFAPFLKLLSDKFKAAKIISIACLIYAFISILMPLYINYLIWVFYASLGTCCMFAYFALMSAILNQNIEDQRRSFIISVVSLFISLGFASGSGLVKLFGANNYQLFICSAMLSGMVSLICLSLKRLPSHLNSNEKTKLIYFLRARPQLFFCKFIQQYLGDTILVFSVIYGINNGFTPENAALMVTAFMLSAFCDLFAGIISDFSSRIKVMNWAILLANLLLLIIWVFAKNYLILLTAFFLIGIAMGMLFISGMAELNSCFEKHELIAANNAFAITGSMGGLIAGTLTGYAMSSFGNLGFSLPIFVISLVYYVLFYSKSKFLT